MSTLLRLTDLAAASQARDPELVPLIEKMASQPDRPPDAPPPREDVASFAGFLANIRSRPFRRLGKDEQRLKRVEMVAALESPTAEIPLPERLRLHEVLFALWRDEGVFARTSLLKVIATVPLVYGPWRALKHIFKEAEARSDWEVYGALAARFDMARSQGRHEVGSATLMYLARRAWRTLRRTGVALPVAYADCAAEILAHYTEETRWDRTWIANHVFFHGTGKYNRNRFQPPLPKNLLKDRAFPDLWKRTPRPLFSLLERAQSDRVREFATEALKADFRAVLREVEPAWVARLVGVGSRAVDDFVVWILTNVPRFEQAAFRTLGLHDAVLRLFDSPSDEARTYAAAYARTHARDLSVPELVRLIDNTNEAVRKLAADLIQARDPRTEIGLEAWGWLLESKQGHKLAAAALRQHFGPKELTPAWFKPRLAARDKTARDFAQKLLLEIHPRDKLGPAFFTELLDPPDTPDGRQPPEALARFALGELSRFDLNALPAEFLRRLLLNPWTGDQAAALVDEGRLKAPTLGVEFLKAVAFAPAWTGDAILAAIRTHDRAWARGLEFRESLSDTVLGWLGDVRQFAPSSLGFDWLMQLVDSSEPRYHDFAVETMIKAFTPADFAPPGAAASPAEAQAGPPALGGQTVVFTGKLATMTRGQAEEKTAGAGGKASSSVTKKLHYLVIGDEGSPLFSGGKKGDKQQKAEELNAAGANIRIISETAFLQLLSGTAAPAASADTVLAGCEVLWRMAVAPGAAEARRGQFARKYLLRHHLEIGPSLTDRPVDPGAEVPAVFLTFARVQPLFAETRKPVRDFAVELGRWEFARWQPPADALLALCELPHVDVRELVADALLADDAVEKRRYRLDVDALTPEAVYRFCESSDSDTRKLGMKVIEKSPRLKVPEELFRLTESPDRAVRGFVIRSLWALYRDRGVTADWKPFVPTAPTTGAAAKKVATKAEPRGPGMPHRPEAMPAPTESLAAFLRRVLFEVPPGRPEATPEATQRLRPLPARLAKLSLVDVMRDLALEDATFAGGVLPLLEEFMRSRGTSERAACLVAVTRIRHHHESLRT